MFAYLDMLRESGVTNMYGSPAYLERDFGLEEKEAREVASNWMTFFSDKPASERADMAYRAKFILTGEKAENEPSRDSDNAK